MKAYFTFCLICAISIGCLKSQTTVFQFTFENTEAVTIDNAVDVPTFAATGVNNPTYPGGATDGDCPTTAAISRSYAGWNTGDNYRFTVNTTGFSDLTFSYCARTSNATVGNFICRVSPDGTTWTTIIAEYIPGTTFAEYSGNLPISCENVSSVFVEVYKTDNAGNTGNNKRIDNATLLGTVILPIELLDFDCEIVKSTTKVNWQTATEIDNSHFSIQRSPNGRDFTEIGQVKGAGTSYEPQNYAFTDERPLPGKNYYRLKQVDFDGKSSYSPVVTATFGKARQMTLAPLPATETLHIQMESPTKDDGIWQVYDMNGRLLLSGEILAESTEQSIQIGGLPEGAYVLRLTMGQEVMVEQFRKI